MYYDKTGCEKSSSVGSGMVAGLAGAAALGYIGATQGATWGAGIGTIGGLPGALVGGAVGGVIGVTGGALLGFGLGYWGNEGFPLPDPFGGLGGNNGNRLPEEDIDGLMAKCCAEHGHGCNESGHETCMRGQWFPCTRSGVVDKYRRGY